MGQKLDAEAGNMPLLFLRKRSNSTGIFFTILLHFPMFLIATVCICMSFTVSLKVITGLKHSGAVCSCTDMMANRD